MTTADLTELAAQAYATARAEYPEVPERARRMKAAVLIRRQVDAPVSLAEVLDAIDKAAIQPRTWVLPDPPGPEVRYLRTALGDIYKREAEGGTRWRYWRKRGFSAGTYGTSEAWVNLLTHVAPLVDATAEIEASLRDDRKA